MLPGLLFPTPPRNRVGPAGTYGRIQIGLTHRLLGLKQSLFVELSSTCVPTRSLSRPAASKGPEGELGDGGVAIGHQPSGEQGRVVVGSTTGSTISSAHPTNPSSCFSPESPPRLVNVPRPPRVRWRAVSSDHPGLSPARASGFRRVEHNGLIRTGGKLLKPILLAPGNNSLQ
jgi:hypothetical protein